MRLFLLPLLIFTFLTMTGVSSANNGDNEYEKLNPATDLLSDTISFGQKNLFALIEIQRNYSGKILIFDSSDSSHGRAMLFNVTQLVPNQYVMMVGNDALAEPADGPLLERRMRTHSARVLHAPNTYHTATDAESGFLKKIKKH